MGEVAKENGEGFQTEGDVVVQYQIVERKKWEQRYMHTLFTHW